MYDTKGDGNITHHFFFVFRILKFPDGLHRQSGNNSYGT